ncbi:hypothetical protein DLAC_07035 [Tieghemostelium lacteum]|uniref:THH1/TOM1/TOM3 domain-containing protein n=1 Tax=Tieghemostelium lacteum TaxID=361077 RepID=A0A151ZE43_TIELA|nr:hypothetical protein DLAC_07035 [Tieghemostelium lacteum]|eukprot:KYQ92189.1 hypothetical protein DLAC_07035 [Tieghemostelium lacteum]
MSNNDTISLVNSTLSSSSSSSFCNTTADCSYRGYCVENICYCNQYVGGKFCDEPFHIYVWSGFQAYRIIFLVTFILLTLYTIYQTYKSFHFWHFKKIVYKLKCINHLIILLFCIFRIIYFSVDPWGTLGKFPYVFTKFLYGFPIYVLFTAYELLLLYWAGTYHNVKNIDNRGRLFYVDKTKPVFIISNSIWFSFEVLRVVLEVTHYDNQGALIYLSLSYNIFVAISCLAILTGFAIYGSLLYKRIKSLPADKEKKKRTLKRLCVTTVIVSVSIFIGLIPSIVFYFLNFYLIPKGALITSSVVNTLEFCLVVELLYIMKPKEAILKSISDEKKYQNGDTPNGADNRRMLFCI